MKKNHTIAEDLILPSAIGLCETALDKECAAKLKLIPFSNNTIGRRIQDMADDVKINLINLLQQANFAY